MTARWHFIGLLLLKKVFTAVIATMIFSFAFSHATYSLEEIIHGKLRPAVSLK